MKISFILCLLPLLISLLASCGDRETHAVRRYTENTVVAAKIPDPHSNPHGATPDSSAAYPTDATLRWTAPAGWTVAENTSAFRLATFQVTGEQGTGECVISRLSSQSSEAGAARPNVVRWLGQIGVSNPDPEALDRFLESAPRMPTRWGTEAAYYDLSELSPDQGTLAAILPAPGAYYFVKMTGPRELLAAEAGRFRELCASLEIR
jgi:hypothetical protein